MPKNINFLVMRRSQKLFVGPTFVGLSLGCCRSRFEIIVLIEDVNFAVLFSCKFFVSGAPARL